MNKYWVFRLDPAESRAELPSNQMQKCALPAHICKTTCADPHCLCSWRSKPVTLGMNAPLKCTSLWIKPSIDFSWSECLEETLATVFWRACSVVSNNSLQPHGRQPTRILRHVIFQARILEWVVISYPRGSSQPRDRTHISCICRRIFYHWAWSVFQNPRQIAFIAKFLTDRQ